MDENTRAETALRRALTREADAFQPAPLEPRTDRRRRGWVLPVAAAAAAVLVVGGGLAVTGALGGGGDGTVAGEDTSTRTVWWKNVAVDVPASWQDGAEPGSAWCATRSGDTSDPGPYVARENPNAVVPSILCAEPADDRPVGFGTAPQDLWAPHVTFVDVAGPGALPEGDQTFDGWTLAVRSVNSEVQLQVWSDGPTAAAAGRVLDSARTFEVDPNGCDVRSPVQAEMPVRPSEAFDVAGVDAVDAIAICQYERSAGGVGLTASRQVTGGDAAALLDGIRSAPVGGGPDRPDECLQSMSGDDALVVRLQRGDQVDDLHVYYDWCSGNGYDDGTNRRELTAANCAPLFGGPVQAFSYSTFLTGRCD